MNKETLQNYNTRLGANNTSLESILETINNLPEAGVSEINLQDKSVDITENGTTTVVADEGYDGLNSVAISTNIGATPEKGFVVTEWDSDGYATKLTTYGFTEIPNYRFAGPNSDPTSSSTPVLSRRLKEITVNEGVTSIGQYAFRYLPIEKINLPNTLVTINRNAFYYDKSLAIKTLPDSVETILAAAFSSNDKLTQMSMRGLKRIGAGGGAEVVFCFGLKAVWVGPNIQELSYYSWSGGVKYIFIDKPRSFVEAMTNYATKWGAPDATLYCNDDEGFMTKEEFDSIDWSNYEY